MPLKVYRSLIVLLLVTYSGIGCNNTQTHTYVHNQAYANALADACIITRINAKTLYKERDSILVDLALALDSIHGVNPDELSLYMETLSSENPEHYKTFLDSVEQRMIYLTDVFISQDTTQAK